MEKKLEEVIEKISDALLEMDNADMICECETINALASLVEARASLL